MPTRSTPSACSEIAEEVRPGVTVLDGAIFGPPPGGQRTARLYLAGEAQPLNQAEPLFNDTALHVRRASG
ncbi:phosphogluconate dehydrogenase, partial [Streptomyces goshikiensis]